MTGDCLFHLRAPPHLSISCHTKTLPRAPSLHHIPHSPLRPQQHLCAHHPRRLGGRGGQERSQPNRVERRRAAFFEHGAGGPKCDKCDGERQGPLQLLQPRKDAQCQRQRRSEGLEGRGLLLYSRLLLYMGVMVRKGFSARFKGSMNKVPILKRGYPAWYNTAPTAQIHTLRI